MNLKVLRWVLFVVSITISAGLGYLGGRIHYRLSLNACQQQNKTLREDLQFAMKRGIWAETKLNVCEGQKNAADNH
jgi:hypothetical protein